MTTLSRIIVISMIAISVLGLIMPSAMTKNILPANLIRDTIDKIAPLSWNPSCADYIDGGFEDFSRCVTLGDRMHDAMSPIFYWIKFFIPFLVIYFFYCNRKLLSLGYGNKKRFLFFLLALLFYVIVFKIGSLLIYNPRAELLLDEATLF